VRVLEITEAIDDLLEGGVADDVLDGKDVDLGEGVEVLADCRVPTRARLGVVAQEVAAFLVEALV
jgi:hypothetical protein